MSMHFVERFSYVMWFICESKHFHRMAEQWNLHSKVFLLSINSHWIYSKSSEQIVRVRAFKIVAFHRNLKVSNCSFPMQIIVIILNQFSNNCLKRINWAISRRKKNIILIHNIANELIMDRIHKMCNEIFHSIAKNIYHLILWEKKDYKNQSFDK